MKGFYVLGTIMLVALLLIGSCSKDDPPPKAGINFEVESLTITESDGTLTSFHPDLISGSTGRDISVKILLDKPLADAVSLQYSVSGTATRTNPPGDDVNDFTIKAGLNTTVLTDRITINKGATEATIIITVYEDFDFEVDDQDNPVETVIIQLTSVASGPAVLGSITTYTLNIEEDDAFIYLIWVVDDTESYGDVDMDMFVWLDNEYINSATYDNNAGTRDPPYEGLYIPAGFPNGIYGMSYTYYSGSSNKVDFAALMWGRFNNTVYPYFSFNTNDVLEFEGTYTLANINKWDLAEGVYPPPVVQTMVKNGVNYNTISPISIPDAGSRISQSYSQKPSRNAAGKLKSVRMVDIPKAILKPE